MLNINRVMITGRLTREPETKYLPSGLAVTNLSIASNRRFQVNNEWREETSFFDIETFGKLAERLAETLRKGQPVYVEGRLKQESWERDGQKQSKVRISADSVKPFDVPQRGQQGEQGGESDSYQDSSSFQSQAPRQQSAPPQRAASPSDNLNFDSGSNVSDDVPF